LHSLPTRRSSDLTREGGRKEGSILSVFEHSHCLTSSHRQYMVPNLTARPLFSPVYLNRTCANSANSAILIIKMLEIIGIMQKLHLYHRLVEKYQYLFSFIIFSFLPF